MLVDIERDWNLSDDEKRREEHTYVFTGSRKMKECLCVVVFYLILKKIKIGKACGAIVPHCTHVYPSLVKYDLTFYVVDARVYF